MAREASNSANVMKRWGNTPAIAKGISTKRHEYQSVDHGGGDELPGTGTASKNVEPTDHRNGQADYAHQRFFVSRECRVPEDGLGDAGPNNEQGADRQVGDAIENRIFRVPT